jgi:hypothetical protein
MTYATRILALAVLVAVPAMAASVVSRSPMHTLRSPRPVMQVVPAPAPPSNVPLGDAASVRGSGSSHTSAVNGDSAYTTWWDIQAGPCMPNRVVNFGSNFGSFMAVGSSAGGAQPANLGAYYATNISGAFKVYDKTGVMANSPLSTSSFYCSMGELSDLSEIAVVKDMGGSQNPMVVMHDSMGPGGQWSTTTIPNSIGWYYPALAVGANNKLHLVVSEQNADRNWAFLYMNSTDLGKTWSQPETLLDTVATEGSYAITANGNNVGIVINFLGYFFLMHSVDNGGWFHGASFPFNSQREYSKWYRKTAGHDTTSYYITDTVLTWGSQFDALIDETGLLHVVAHPSWGYIDSVVIAGGYKGKHFHTTGQLSLLTGQSDVADSVNGLVYFSVDTTQVLDFQYMGPAEGDPYGSWSSQDLGANGFYFWGPDYGGQTEAWLGHPQLGYNQTTKKLYCAYETFSRTDVEMYRNTYKFMYEHIYGTTLSPGGRWTNPALLSREGNDAQFPSVADVVDNNVVMSYQSDTHTGNYILYVRNNQTPPLPATACALVGWVVGESAFTLGGVEQVSTVPGTFELAQNYPNPFNPSTHIRYTLERSASVRLTVSDAIGRTIASLTNGRQSGGTYNVTYDASQLPSGVYTYTLTVDGKPSSKQMVLSK